MQLLVFLLLCFIWGTTWVAIKISLAYEGAGIPPFLGASARFLVAVVFLLLYAAIRRISLKVPRQLMAPLIWSSVFLYLIDYGLIYWGEQYLRAGVTAVFFATSPFFTAILAKFFLRSERLTAGVFLGLILGFGGVVLTFYEEFYKTNFDTIVILATLGIIVAAIASAVALIITKKYLRDLHPVSLSLYQMLWGIAGLMLMGLTNGEASHIKLNGHIALAVLYLGAVGSALAFAMYYWLLQKVSAVTVSLIIYITPMVALVTDWLVLEQPITMRLLLGIVLILTGIALSESRKYRAPGSAAATQAKT